MGTFFETQCICRVSFNRYLSLSLEVVEKRNKCKSFLVPLFSGGTTPSSIRQIVSVNYHRLFGTVWLSSVCWSLSAKPGNEVECRFYGGWVKTHFQFEAICGPKFVLFWDEALMWFYEVLYPFTFSSLLCVGRAVSRYAATWYCPHSLVEAGACEAGAAAELALTRKVMKYAAIEETRCISNISQGKWVSV